jgi:hypothetical protein
LGPILLELAARLAFIPLASRRVSTRQHRRCGRRLARPFEVEFRYGIGRQKRCDAVKTIGNKPGIS